MQRLEMIKCRVCGGELKEYGAGKYKCTHCNAIYKEADVKAYAEEIELAHERSKSYCEAKE